MTKKVLLQWMALLLALAPALGLFGGTASAASSRVAIIKSLKGAVVVKKAGGSKEFKAFARMSLNEGDVLATGADSTAVLQFANGTSEDDQMSVSANTTLSFSKLTERGGTRTKVSMWSGSAWVDVKSIANKNDEFTLETPTAIMGVRGTHFFTGVDPETNTTFLGVLAGIVNAQRNAGSAGSNEPADNDSANIYPTQQFMFGTDDSNPQNYVSTIDMDNLAKMLSPDVIQQMLQQKAAIDAENAEMRQRLTKQMQDEAQNGLPNGMSGVANTEELQQLIDNMNRAIAALIESAIQGKIIDKETIDRMIKDLNQELVYSNTKLALTERQKKLQDEAREREEARRKAMQEAEQKRDKAKDELLNKKKELEEKNKKKLENLKEQQKAAYEKKLSEAEKARFEQERRQREAEAAGNASTSLGNEGSGTGGSSGGDTGSSYVNPLAQLTVNYSEPTAVPSASPTPSPVPSSYVSKQIQVPIQSGVSAYTSNLDYVIGDTLSLMPVAKNSTDVITVKTRIGAEDSLAVPVTPQSMYTIDNVESGAPTVYYPVELRGRTTYIDIWVKTATNSIPTKFTYQVNRKLLPSDVTISETRGIDLADFGGNRLLLEGSDGLYDFAVNGQGVSHLQVDGVGSTVDQQSNVIHLQVPQENDLYTYWIDFKVDNKHYEYELIVKTVFGSPFAQTDKTWIADVLEIMTENEDWLPVEWDSSSSSFNISANAEDGGIVLIPPYNGDQSAFTIEAVEDLASGTIMMPTYGGFAYGYMLDTDSPQHAYRLYLKDASGKYNYSYNLQLTVNPWPVGVVEMKAGFASGLNGEIEETVQLKLHDYLPWDRDYKPYVAQPTVTSLVYGELQITVDPNLVDDIMLVKGQTSLSAEYIEATDTYVISRSELAMTPGINSYWLKLYDTGEQTVREYEIVLVGGDVLEEELYGGQANETGEFERVGPNEWTYYSNNGVLSPFEFYIESNPEDTEVWVGSEKLNPDGWIYYLHGLVGGEIVPIEIKLHNSYHIGNPTIHHLTFYNSEAADTAPGLQSLNRWNGAEWEPLIDPQPQPFSINAPVNGESHLLLPVADNGASVIAVYGWDDGDLQPIEQVNGGYPVNIALNDTKMLFVIVESGPYKKSVQVLLHRSY